MKNTILWAFLAVLAQVAAGCVANPVTDGTQVGEKQPAEVPETPSNPGNPGIPENPQEPAPQPQPTPDPDDKFATLDGIDDFLSYSGDLVGGQTSYTVEFFVKFDHLALTAVGQSLFSFTDSIGLVSGLVQKETLGSPSLLTIMNGGGHGTALTLETNRWYHVAVSFANNSGSFTRRFHLDGVLQGSGGGSQAYISFSEAFHIGKPFGVIGGMSAFFKGSIDGLRISRGARYAAGSFSVPNRKSMAADANTLAVWNFNETGDDGKYYDSVSQKLLQRQ